MTADPLRLSFVIACAPDHAFDVWTTRFTQWWPSGHSASGDPDTMVTLEPGVGGRIYERTSDGVVIAWGEVTAWEPPRRLGYLWHNCRSSTPGGSASGTTVPRGAAPTQQDGARWCPPSGSRPRRSELASVEKRHFNFDLDRTSARKCGHPDRGAGMAPGRAEHVVQECARAIDDRGLADEPRN